MKFVITGPVPSQKNNKEIAITANGRRFVRSNDRVKDWQKDAHWQLLQQSRRQVLAPIASLQLIFYFDNLRRHDLDNAAGGVMDALVKAHILKDDCVGVVDDLRLLYGGLDKQNPRVEILIKEK